MVVSLLFAVAGIGVLSALMFKAAIYALPVVTGIWVLQRGLATGLGGPASIGCAIAVGALIYAAGHLVFERSRSTQLRLIVAVLFVVPAVLAGYSLTLGLLGVAISCTLWAEELGALGGLAVGAAAFVRLTRSNSAH